MRTEVIGEFLVFAQHLSFSGAARELHMTQPNLSKHMTDLEREVGVELIDRKKYGKNKPVLSAAGKYFYEEMSYLLTNFQNTITRCRVIGRSNLRDIRIQELWQNNAMVKLYSIVGAFQAEYPSNTLRYVRLTQKHPIDALLENEFDLVFDVWCGSAGERCRQLAERGVQAVHFLTEPPVIWFQDGNRHLEGKQSISFDELLDVPVILTRGSSLDYVVTAYADYCERVGLPARLRRLQPADNSPTGMFMSDFGDGALMTTPAMIQDPRLKSRSDLRHLQIDDPRVAMAFLLAVRAADAESVSFLDFARKHADFE